ncbi:hypothetical protein [Paraliobacillus sp. X-1268]|uniref:hypothetical protein n=1 Tax=Paraliobacillus sp. X-1268 TaxID=2213193 RepID=UPI0013007358|nr:hypothetical protein [Paraliobacillus sp. X-1268]
MFGFRNYIYEILAEVDNWRCIRILESETELSTEEVKQQAMELFEGDNVKLIGYNKKYY